MSRVIMVGARIGADVVGRARRPMVAIVTIVATVSALLSATVVASGVGSFSAAGFTAVPREGHTASLLPDGRVLVVGGSEKPATAEIWDPVTPPSV